MLELVLIRSFVTKYAGWFLVLPLILIRHFMVLFGLTGSGGTVSQLVEKDLSFGELGLAGGASFR